jgi:uncharacterized membrane protein
MALEKNVGGRDRTVRGVVGASLVAVALGALLTGRSSAGVVAGVVGAGLLFNAATQFCGLNALLGIDTCSRE